MLDVFDVELQKSEEEARRAPLPARVPLSWVAAALLATAVGIGAWAWNAPSEAVATNEVTVSVSDGAPPRR